MKLKNIYSIAFAATLILGVHTIRTTFTLIVGKSERLKKITDESFFVGKSLLEEETICHGHGSYKVKASGTDITHYRTLTKNSTLQFKYYTAKHHYPPNATLPEIMESIYPNIERIMKITTDDIYWIFVIDIDQATTIEIPASLAEKLDNIIYLPTNETINHVLETSDPLYNLSFAELFKDIDLNVSPNVNLNDFATIHANLSRKQYDLSTQAGAKEYLHDMLILAKLHDNKKLFRGIINSLHTMNILKQIKTDDENTLPPELAANIVGSTGVESLAGKRISPQPQWWQSKLCKYLAITATTTGAIIGVMFYLS